MAYTGPRIEEWSPAVMLAGARNAAKRLTPESLRQWQEDIAQDVALELLRQRQAGIPIGLSNYKFAALHAVRRLCVLLRGQQWEESWVGEEPAVVPDELGAIALWRLQESWEEFTELQQRALLALLTGERTRDIEASGVGRASLANARRTVLARLDNPQAFKKRPRHSGRTHTLRPPDPVKRAAELEADREYQRARRAKARAA